METSFCKTNGSFLILKGLITSRYAALASQNKNLPRTLKRFQVSELEIKTKPKRPLLTIKKGVSISYYILNVKTNSK